MTIWETQMSFFAKSYSIPVIKAIAISKWINVCSIYFNVIIIIIIADSNLLCKCPNCISNNYYAVADSLSN